MGKELFLFIKETIKNIGVPEHLIKNKSYIRKDLQLDSVEIVDLVMAVKKKYNIPIKIDTSKDLTIGQFCEKIEELI